LESLPERRQVLFGWLGATHLVVGPILYLWAKKQLSATLQLSIGYQSEDSKRRSTQCYVFKLAEPFPTLSLNLIRHNPGAPG
jgi:hypothetical protein